MSNEEFISINKVAEAKGLKSNRSLRLEINKPESKYIVHYQGSNYSQSNAISFISQENKKEFSITVVTRDLRGNEGAYEFIDKVKSVLTGFEPDSCSKLMPSKDFFISENGGIWQYGINFSLTTTNIQDF